MFRIASGRRGISTVSSIARSAEASAPAVRSMTCAWYSWYASQSLTRSCSISSTDSSRPTLSTVTPTFEAHPPDSQTGSWPSMEREIVWSWIFMKWRKEKASGSTPARSWWFTCSSVRSFAAQP
jgi:hypothetical protein